MSGNPEAQGNHRGPAPVNLDVLHNLDDDLSTAIYSSRYPIADSLILPVTLPTHAPLKSSQQFYAPNDNFFELLLPSGKI